MSRKDNMVSQFGAFCAGRGGFRDSSGRRGGSGEDGGDARCSGWRRIPPEGGEAHDSSRDGREAGLIVDVNQQPVTSFMSVVIIEARIKRKRNEDCLYLQMSDVH